MHSLVKKSVMRSIFVEFRSNKKYHSPQTFIDRDFSIVSTSSATTFRCVIRSSVVYNCSTDGYSVNIRKFPRKYTS